SQKSRNTIDFVYFRSRNTAIGIGNAEKKVDYLQPAFIPSALAEQIADIPCRYFAFFYYFIKNLKCCICALPAISLHKILAYVIQFGLAHIAICLNYQRGQ